MIRDLRIFVIPVVVAVVLINVEQLYVVPWIKGIDRPDDKFTERVITTGSTDRHSFSCPLSYSQFGSWTYEVVDEMIRLSLCWEPA